MKNSILWCHYEFISGLWWPSLDRESLLSQKCLVFFLNLYKKYICLSLEFWFNFNPKVNYTIGRRWHLALKLETPYPWIFSTDYIYIYIYIYIYACVCVCVCVCWHSLALHLILYTLSLSLSLSLSLYLRKR